MTTFPRSPRLLKGALVTVAAPGAPPSVVVFQYTPDTLTRTLQAQTAGGDGGERSEATRLKGPPAETIKLDVEIDATDQLEQANESAIRTGIYPQLSALEMLLYPPSRAVVANSVLLALGTIEVLPPPAPLTLLVWGPKRILPVRLTDFSITEEAYDPALNPIRARVSLGLRVLSYADLPFGHPGYHLFLSHQTVKEALAQAGTATSVAATGATVSIPPR